MSVLPEDPYALLEQVKQGSEQAFDRFYQRYFPFVFRLALKWTNNPHEAEDVCHDVLLDLFQRPQIFDPQRGSMESFLAVKTKNKCFDLLRKRQKVAFQEPCEIELTKEKRGRLGQQSFANPTLEHVLSQEKKHMVRQALSKLPEGQRLAVYGSYVEQLPQRTLAEQLQKPLGTIKSLIRYGLRNMKKQLGQSAESHVGGERHGK